jgi:hypothetical protein
MCWHWCCSRPLRGTSRSAIWVLTIVRSASPETELALLAGLAGASRAGGFPGRPATREVFAFGSAWVPRG